MKPARVHPAWTFTVAAILGITTFWLITAVTSAHYAVASLVATGVGTFHVTWSKRNDPFLPLRKAGPWRSFMVHAMILIASTGAVVAVVEALQVEPIAAYGLLLVPGAIVLLVTGARDMGASARSSAIDLVPVAPPSDDEKYGYLRGPQHRWLFVTSAVAFVGVAFSLGALALRSDWTVVLVIPLVILVIEQLFALRTSTYRRRLDEAAHRERVAGWAPRTLPSVDIFLPTCGERIEVLRNTYLHVAEIAYAGAISVHVLDDAGRGEVRALAAEHGFEYLSRPGSEFKKAGNLRYAYARTCADHIAILDADFVPRPEFLTELLPYMDDDGIGIVQSPQYFATTSDQSWLQRAAGATQELFFRFIQPSRDAVGAAICVGTSAVYRRAALDAIGGFPPIDHSEDVFTGIEMGRQGWSLRYVPIVVSGGLCPDTIDSFATQQYRWCEGSMALVADRRFHQDESMSVSQRLCYWSGFLYYMTTAMAAIVAPLPLLIMLFAFGSSIRASFILPLLGAVFFWVVVMPAVSRTRWRYEVIRVQVIYGVAHLICIVDMLRGAPTEWVPTGSGSVRSRSSVASRVRWYIVIYLGATQIATLVGLVIASGQAGFESVWPNFVLYVLQAYILIPVIIIAARGLGVGRSVRMARSTLSWDGNR